jgi:hypothetical protein
MAILLNGLKIKTMAKKQPEKTMAESLDELIQSVENRVLLQTTNYLTNYVSDRLDELKKTREADTSEFDYCEHLGRIKELELFLKTIKELT